VVSYAESHGIADLSLRQLADAIGTSHHMLICHFGSREGLLVRSYTPPRPPSVAASLSWLPILRWNRRCHQDDVAGLGRRHIAAPGRFFFELYGRALQGRPGTAGFLSDIVDSWIAVTAECWARWSTWPAAARADARRGVAVVRGLLLDLCRSPPRPGVPATRRL
jgi:AcrR family transcriptional regulator